MQVRAIFEAACDVKKEGIDVNPWVMIPLIGHVNELKVATQRMYEVNHTRDEFIKLIGKSYIK